VVYRAAWSEVDVGLLAGRAVRLGVGSSGKVLAGHRLVGGGGGRGSGVSRGDRAQGGRWFSVSAIESAGDVGGGMVGCGGRRAPSGHGFL